MTGRKNGLIGRFVRENPHLVNTHCTAHKLALCTEQAADNLNGMISLIYFVTATVVIKY